MGGKFTKTQKTYSERFPEMVFIPAHIYSYFSGVRLKEDPEMTFGAFIELMLTKKDRRTPTDPTMEIKTSIITILGLLFPKKTNYLSALKTDEVLDANDIILPLSILQAILPSVDTKSGDSLPTKSRRPAPSDSGSLISARIETSSNASSIGSKKSKKSDKKTSERINESLSKVMSPYHFKLITLMQDLLRNQTEFERVQQQLEITADALYNYVFSLFYDLLKDMISTTEESTDEIVNKKSIRLCDGNSNTTTECQSTITDLYQSSLRNLDDKTPANTKLVDLAQFYGRMFSALVSKNGVFEFFDSSRSQPDQFMNLGRDFSRQSANLFEKLFNQCLSVECNSVIQIIRKISQSVENTEIQMRAYFHLLAKLVQQVVVYNTPLETFLADYSDRMLINHITENIQHFASEEKRPEPRPEDKADFLECFVVLLKEFPRQALTVKGSNIDFGAIVRSSENKVIYQSLSEEACRIRQQIKQNQHAEQCFTIEEGTASQENTPAKPGANREDRSALATSMQKALNFGGVDVPPPPQTTPEHEETLSLSNRK